jgi:hypothetical protein
LRGKSWELFVRELLTLLLLDVMYWLVRRARSSCK